MKKLFLALLLGLSLFSSYAQEKVELEGVTMPRTITLNNKKINLNGFGIRSKAWIDVYVQALYLTTLSQDAKYILESETDMAIRIEIISKLVSSNKFKKAFETGFEKSCGDKLTEMIPKIQEFKSLFNEEIIKGDIFVLMYNPSENAVLVYKNDKLKGKISGKDFKLALFGIWLNDNPVDKDLKNHLLGIEK